MQFSRIWGNCLLALLSLVLLGSPAACTVIDETSATPQPSPGPTPTTLADALKVILATNGAAHAATATTPVTTYTSTLTQAGQVTVLADGTSFKVRPGISAAEVRIGPGLQFALVTYLHEGDATHVVASNGQSDTWYLIALEENGRTGWVLATALEPVGPFETAVIPTAATIPPVPFPTVTRTPAGQSSFSNKGTQEAISPTPPLTPAIIDLPLPTPTENPYP